MGVIRTLVSLMQTENPLEAHLVQVYQNRSRLAGVPQAPVFPCLALCGLTRSLGLASREPPTWQSPRKAEAWQTLVPSGLKNMTAGLVHARFIFSGAWWCSRTPAALS